MIRATALLGVLFISLSGCGKSEEDGVVKRPGQPDFVTKYDPKRMDRAIAEAKSTFDEFARAIDPKRPGTSAFTLKKGFPTSTGSLEFIWISDVRKKGDRFEGEIDNEPVDVASLKVGQKVTVSREDVVDWMFQEAGRTRGAYTIAALVYGTPDQKAYEKQLGIKDWSGYRFLKDR